MTRRLPAIATAVALLAWGAAPAFAWDGGYAGLGMGYGSSVVETDGRFGGDSLGLDLGASGALLTGYGGYGWSRGGLYLGGEANYGLSALSGSMRLNDSRLDVDTREGWGFTGVMGGLLNQDTLLYGRAGYQQRKYDLSLPGFREQDWLDGLRIGAGAEFRVSGHSSIRFEYNQVWYGEERAGSGGNAVDYQPRERWFEAGGVLRF
ncbi:outer membrane protein [Aquisalimonas asiatica]|uniref:Outer membrane protein beta-barrel domain-containing protein n=1 Tax=Aquisalimonas asiatica TaxID=406100 RepID=A0A1H8VKQ4_9GAMM|nr:outer membrane beta-barrel protein [Aquisalimonas asiatica]SEP16001.1 Outer membrane protein beta-barrel domain-containing protein [Aquisalimonas asiatica]